MTFRRFVTRVNRLFLTLAGVISLAILAAISYDLVLRNVFDSPTLWALDVSRFLLVFVAFFAMAPALEHGSHVTVDLVEMQLPPRVRRIVKIVAHLLVLAFGAYLLWQMSKATWEAFDEDGLFPTVVPIKLKYVYWVGPLGMLQFMLTSLVQLAEQVSSPVYLERPFDPAG